MDLRICLLGLALLLAPALSPPSLAAAPAVPMTAENKHGLWLADIIDRRDGAAFAARIDIDALAARTAKGLDLDDTTRRGFIKGMTGAKQRMAETMLARVELNRGKARLVRSTTTAGGSTQIVRIDMSDAEGDPAGMEYLAFELDAKGRIVDWTAHSQGARTSDVMRRLSLAMIQDRGAIARAFGITRVDEATLATTQALAKQMAAMDFDGAYTNLARMPEAYKATKDWAALRVNLASQLDDTRYRASLQHIAAHHADAPGLQFMLIDHYFFEDRHAQVIRTVEAFERGVVEDGATNLLKCISANTLKAYDDAGRFCARSIEIEPDVENAWWMLVTVGHGARDAGLVLRTLDGYERQFGTRFEPAKLVALDEYRWLADEPAFKAWAKARR